MERWTPTEEKRASFAAKSNSNPTTDSGSSGSSQSKKLTLTLKRKSEYMSGSDAEDEESGSEIGGDQAQDREVIDLVTPSPPPSSSRVDTALPALESTTNTTHPSSSNTSSAAQQSSQPTSLNTTQSASGNTTSTSSSRPKKKAKLALRASYESNEDERDHERYDPALIATVAEEQDELDYLFNAEFDRLSEEEEDDDAEGGYGSSPPLDTNYYSTALTVAQYPQVFEIPTARPCIGCCTTQDVPIPSIEAPGAVDRQTAIHDLMEHLIDAAYDERTEGYVKWKVEVFVHDNNGCCEGANGEDDCGVLTGTLDISSAQSIHLGTLDSVFPDYDHPNRQHPDTNYLFKRRSAWQEVNLRPTQEEIKWVEAEDGGQDMEVPEGEEGFELAKQKARAACMGWVKEESGGVVVFIDGRDVKVFIKESVAGADDDDEIEVMSPEEFQRAEEEKAAAEKKKQMEEIHAHMRDYEARMKASLVDREGKPLFYRDGKPLRYTGGKSRTAKEEWEM